MFLSSMPHREDEYKLFLFRLGSQRKSGTGRAEKGRQSVGFLGEKSSFTE